MTNLVTRYLRLEWAFFKNCLARDLQYRANFGLVFLVDVCWYAVNIAFFEVIYLNADSIAGYSRTDVLFFMATIFVVDALDMALFSTGMWVLSDLIRKGDFDMVLTKPVSPMFFATNRYVSFGSILDLVLACGILVYAWSQLTLSPSVLDVIGYVVLMLSGLVVFYSLQVIFAAFGFLFVNASGGLQWAFHHLYQLALKPESIYKGVLRFSLIYLLPMLVIGAYPSLMILRGFSLDVFLTSLAVAAVFLIVAIKFFYFGVRRYESASS
jgi:ABC-2 type transport system permease protein